MPTKEDVRKYIQERACPCCGSIDGEFYNRPDSQEFSEYEGKEAIFRDVQCSECYESWTSIYVLVAAKDFGKEL